MAPASPRHSRKPRAVAFCAASFLAFLLAGCAGQPAFVAADYAKCQELGFVPQSREYAICLTEVQKQRTTTFAAAPDQITQ